MTSERADNKCEKCGKVFHMVQTHAEFEEELCCGKCSKEFKPTPALVWYPEGNKKK